MSRALLAACAVGLLGAACDTPAPAPAAPVWTAFTLKAALDEGRDLGVGLDPVFPAFSPKAFLNPQGNILLSPIFGRGPGAYVTTDLWVNNPVVWVQPMYVLVTAWDQAAPATHRLRGPNGQPSRAIFAVGPRSRFWSPYWQVFYVQVPKETPLDAIRTVKQIRDGKYPIRPGPGRLCSVVPRGMTVDVNGPVPLPQLLGSSEPDAVAGFQGSLARSFSLGEGWVEGEDEPMQVMDFGTDRFEWNERREVIEQPLYHFAFRDRDGVWKPIGDLPRVGGTGPLFAGRPAVAPGNKPLYGSLWRLWAVRLPPNPTPTDAGAPLRRPTLFLPDLPEIAGVRARILAEADRWGIGIVESVEGADPAVVRGSALKLAWNPACFGNGQFPAGCQFLDSQEALETHLPTALARSGVLVNCPYVAHDGKVVTP